MGLSNFKQERLRDAKYLKSFQGLSCCYGGKYLPCSGDVVGCHIRMGSGAGMGIKPDDFRCIPLCAAHHTYQHSKGEPFFHGDKLRDAVALAKSLYEHRADVKAQEKLIADFRRLIQ